MKSTIQWFSLLIAALLTLSLFTACGNENQDNPPTTSAENETYEGLTPKQVYETLLKTDDFVFITVMDRKVEGANISMTYMLEKDGNVIRYTVHQDAEDNTYDVSSVIYLDLAKRICIAPSGEDEWYILEESEDFSVDALVTNCTPADLLFDDSHYKVSGKKYLLTEEAILKIIGSKTATVSGQMLADGENYTFEVVTKEAGNTVTMTTKVLFRKVSVAMPSYNTNTPAQSGTAATDEPDLPEPSGEPDAPANSEDQSN